MYVCDSVLYVCVRISLMLLFVCVCGVRAYVCINIPWFSG